LVFTFFRIVELCVDGLLTSFFILKYKQKIQKKINNHQK